MNSGAVLNPLEVAIERSLFVAEAIEPISAVAAGRGHPLVDIRSGRVVNSRPHALLDHLFRRPGKQVNEQGSNRYSGDQPVEPVARGGQRYSCAPACVGPALGERPYERPQSICAPRSPRWAMFARAPFVDGKCCPFRIGAGPCCSAHAPSQSGARILGGGRRASCLERQRRIGSSDILARTGWDLDRLFG